MIKPIFQYLRDEGAPRWSNIVIAPETFISVLTGYAFMHFGWKWFSTSPKVADLTTGMIAYAAIALGFCVAGLTISLTLPDHDFASQLACRKEPDERTNAYSDLLFVFSWTAIVHWGALVSLFAVLLFNEGSSALVPTGCSFLRKSSISAVAAICTYCLCQFLITLITLSQVGRVYIQHLVREHSDEAKAAK
jgi:hypothetical protein